MDALRKVAIVDDDVLRILENVSKTHDRFDAREFVASLKAVQLTVSSHGNLTGKSPMTSYIDDIGRETIYWCRPTYSSPSQEGTRAQIAR